MSSLNQVLLIGNLGNDVELRYTQSGQTIANFSLATSENYKEEDGSIGQKTEWHKIVVFGKLAENCSKYLQKGNKVFIEGKLQTRKWQDKSGQTRYVTEVIAQQIKFLDKKGNE